MEGNPPFLGWLFIIVSKPSPASPERCPRAELRGSMNCVLNVGVLAWAAAGCGSSQAISSETRQGVTGLSLGRQRR